MTFRTKVISGVVMAAVLWNVAFMALADYSTDLTGSGSCTADTSYGSGYECDKAFDDNTGTSWSSSTGAFPHWIKYDFGNGVAYAITKMTLEMTVDASNHSKSFDLEGSNDNSSWSNVYSGVHADDETQQTFTFANTTAYRYYRLTFTDNWSGGTASNIKELEYMNTLGSPIATSTLSE